MSSSVAINLLKPTTSNVKIVLSFLSIRQNPQTSFIRVFKKNVTIPIKTQQIIKIRIIDKHVRSQYKNNNIIILGTKCL